MNEMMERVCRAICSLRCQGAYIRNKPCIDEETQKYAPCRATINQLILGNEYDQAKRALMAMREPTESMIYEGKYLTSGDTQGRAKHIWQRMIDEALR